jgi:serine acetyltransferase
MTLTMASRYNEAETRLRLPPISEWGRHNENPSDLSFWALILEDLRTHDGNPFEQGFWALAVNRFGNWRMDLPSLLRAPCSVLYHVLEKLVQILAGISLPYTCKLGRRIHLWHHGGMILGARYIGNDVHIRQNVSIGLAQTWNTQLPIIEDGVDIGAGAAILGRVHIGRRVKIAANSTVVADVPDDSTVIGVPAKVFPTFARAPVRAAQVRPVGTENERPAETAARAGRR